LLARAERPTYADDCALTAAVAGAFDGCEPVLAPAAIGSRRLAAKDAAATTET
jgi:hypothetical protein